MMKGTLQITFTWVPYRPTDRPTDRQTDRVYCRGASLLKIYRIGLAMDLLGRSGFFVRRPCWYNEKYLCSPFSPAHTHFVTSTHSEWNWNRRCLIDKWYMYVILKERISLLSIILLVCGLVDYKRSRYIESPGFGAVHHMYLDCVKCTEREEVTLAF